MFIVALVMGLGEKMHRGMRPINFNSTSLALPYSCSLKATGFKSSVLMHSVAEARRYSHYSHSHL